MNIFIRMCVMRTSIIGMLAFMSTAAFAGPTEEARTVIDRWSAAYTSNDPEVIVSNYWPDAILLGTVSPVISIGTDAIRTYFSGVKEWQ